MTDAGHTCLTFSPDDPLLRQLGLGAAALRYASMGYAVLPLASKAKKPHSMLGPQGGVWHATKNPAQITSWWGADPSAGIGISCGLASSLVVIDLDVKSGHDGYAGFEGMRDAFALPLPMGIPVAWTPSGGQHLYLRIPPGADIGQRNGILDGVDFKAAGGYVVAPPTMIIQPTLDGVDLLLPYRWAYGCPCSVPMAPDWIRQWVESRPPAAAGSGVTAGPAVDLGELQDNGLQEGARNTGLHLLACSLYGRFGTGIEAQAEVWKHIQQVLAKTPRAGFSQNEISTTLASARQWVTRAREQEDDHKLEDIRRWLPR